MSDYERARLYLEDIGEPFDEDDVYDLVEVWAELRTIESMGWDNYTGVPNWEERILE